MQFGDELILIAQNNERTYLFLILYLSKELNRISQLRLSVAPERIDTFTAYDVNLTLNENQSFLVHILN